MNNKLDIVFNLDDEYYGIYVNNNLEIFNEDTCCPHSWCEMIKKYKSFEEINKWILTEEGYNSYIKSHKNLPTVFNDINYTEIIKLAKDVIK